MGSVILPLCIAKARSSRQAALAAGASLVSTNFFATLQRQEQNFFKNVKRNNSQNTK
jgi:hypothetical protein